MICPYCNNEIAYGNTTCPACGAELSNALGEGKVVLHGYPGTGLLEFKIVCSIEGKVVAEIGMASRSTKIPIEIPVAQDCFMEFELEDSLKSRLFSWGNLLGKKQNIQLHTGKITHVFFSMDRFTGVPEAKVTIE